MAIENPWRSLQAPYRRYLWPEDICAYRRDMPELVGAAYKRVVAELGIGTGTLLTEMARQNPDTFFVGVDLFYKPLGKTAKRLHRAGAGDNVRLLRYSANHPAILFPDAFLDGVIVNFPEPWPKARHARNRIFYGPTARHFYQVLKPGGWIFVRTDNRAYYESARELLTAEAFAVCQDVFPSMINPRAKSGFQSLFEGQGLEIFMLTATK